MRAYEGRDRNLSWPTFLHWPLRHLPVSHGAALHFESAACARKLSLDVKLPLHQRAITYSHVAARRNKCTKTRPADRRANKCKRPQSAFAGFAVKKNADAHTSGKRSQSVLPWQRGISVTHHVWVASGYLNCLSVEVNNEAKCFASSGELSAFWFMLHRSW